jgi:hypothetical protein
MASFPAAIAGGVNLREISGFNGGVLKTMSCGKQNREVW